MTSFGENSTNNHEYRCINCNKLLAKGEIESGAFEIKCNRCGTSNALFGKMSDQIIVTDYDGLILYANPSLLSTTGYCLEEVIGKTPKLWGGLMSKEFYQTLWHKIKDEKQPTSVIVTNKHKNGEHYQAKLQISPVCDTNGDIKFFVGIESVIK